MSDIRNVRVAQGKHPTRRQPDNLVIGLTILALVLVCIMGVRQVGPYVVARLENRSNDLNELVLRHDLGPILVAYPGGGTHHPDSRGAHHRFVTRSPSRDLSGSAACGAWRLQLGVRGGYASTYQCSIFDSSRNQNGGENLPNVISALMVLFTVRS